VSTKRQIQDILERANQPMSANQIIEIIRVNDEGPKASSLRKELGRLTTTGVVKNLAAQGYPGSYVMAQS
jgi:Fe2+ or Zn2+ uptake regulation protein